MEAPNDTKKVLMSLIEASKRVVQDAPIHRRLLLQGAIIDAEDLVSEIEGSPRKDTLEQALNVLRDAARKA